MKRILLFVILVSSFTFLLSSCMLRRGVVVTSNSGATVRYHYWYYPSIQVYFDYERKVYYYPENGGWHSDSRLPARFSTGSSYVVMDEDSDRPYVNHDMHLKKYPFRPMMKKGKKGQGNWNKDDRRDNDDKRDNH